MDINEKHSYELVDLHEVLSRRTYHKSYWKQMFDDLPKDKAAMLKYNNRQRAHQIAASIRTSARYHNIKIGTRIIHAEPAIHGTDGWLVYLWKKDEQE